jgi:uncharacterized alpha-E superfamily protein
MGRLEPVDVILRRVDDHYCDPLELRADSRLGVPGLTEAARRGSVVVANMLGASVLENPALNAFLPALARHFLGQDLLLPSAATWWCGQPAEREHVLANLERLVIKTIHREAGGQPVFGAYLSAQERRGLAERIKAQPYLYVGQEQVSFSSTPALANGRLEPRAAILRSFLVAREDGYVVMPGGLTRIAPGGDTWVVSNQAGGVSKDTWILATEPEKQVSLIPAVAPAPAPQREPALPSATADNSFWLGRYAERGEQGIRSLRTVLRAYRQATEYHNPSDRRALDVLLEGLTTTTVTFPGFVGEDAHAKTLREDPQSELLALACDGSRVGSIPYNLRAMLQAAFATRDRLSADTWRIIGDVRERLDLLANAPPSQIATLKQALDALLTDLLALAGIAAESTTRAQAWRFLEIGRRLERALQSAALAEVLFAVARDPAVEYTLVEAVLLATDSSMAYRRVHHEQIAVESALSWVLLESSNPRSLGFQLQRLQEQVDALPMGDGEHARTREQRLLLDASTRLCLAEPGALAQVSEGRRAELEAVLAHVAACLRAVSDALSEKYFVDVQGPQQLVPTQARSGQ